MKYISIHHSAPLKSEREYYIKGKTYTEEEYLKLIYRKQLIKDVVLMTVLGVVMAFRAYVFFKYGQ